ncbi:MAG: hypothetical protein HFF50_05425 [Lawsonibacter sp.]|nr:hypothetical protein [Lawsonibacter sp.]
MKRRYVWLWAGCLLLALLVGCAQHGTPHSRREVLEYVEETFLGEDIVVSKQYTRPAEGDRFQEKDRLWDCWYADMPQVVFHIGSRRWVIDPVPMWGYELYNDRDRVFWNYHLEQYQTGGGSLELWTSDEEGNLEWAFSSMEQVPQAAEQLLSFFRWYEEQPHAHWADLAEVELEGLPLPVHVLDPHHIYLHAPARPVEGTRLSFAEDTAELEALCAGMLKAYFTYYRLPSPDFSQTELDAYAAQAWTRAWTEGEELQYVPRLWRDGKPISAELVVGIGAEKVAGSGLEFSYVSFGGLFELVSRLGLEPEGTSEDFTVTGADGALYAFSYASGRERDGEDGWSYTRDGERLKGRDGMPILRIGGGEFQAVTGLEFRG